MNRSVALIALLAVTQLLACQIAYLLPSSTATPTRTRTRTPTSVAQPLPPSTPTVVVQALPTPPPPAEITAIAQDNLRIRANPSTSAAVVGRLNKGESALVVGRTAASDWLQIALPTNTSQTGWIAADFATPSGALDSVPVVQPGGSSVPPPPSNPPTKPSYPG